MRQKIHFATRAGNIVISVKAAKVVLKERLRDYRASYAKNGILKKSSGRRRITARISWKAHIVECPNCSARHTPTQDDIECPCGVNINVRRKYFLK